MPTPNGRTVRFAGLLLASALAATGCRLPDVPDLEQEQRRPPPLDQTSVVYDAAGNRLATLHAEQNRIVVPYDRIPRVVQDAVVAIEDQRFWSHEGVDVKALLRAAVANARSGRIVEGGSTITQQYVKNTIVGPEKTIDRKFRESVLALQLEDKMSKQEILTAYLNTVYFGSGAYGIQVAARTYFSKPAAHLSLAESALLAGLIAGPERWDPLDDREAAIGRRNYVLDRMLSLGMIDQAQHASAVRLPLGLHLEPKRPKGPAAHFVNYVKHLILNSRDFGPTYSDRYDFLFRGGLRIHTTLDPRMQRAAEDALRGVLSQPGDPYGALSAVDPRTGNIKAMVSGRGWRPGKRDPYAQVNLATGGITGRQAGSSFKPFALVAALENGISPTTVYRGGSSIVISDPRCPGTEFNPWYVRNYEGTVYGNLTLEQATISSVNVVYAQVIRDLTPDEVVRTAGRMGIRSKLRPYCSAVLGANEVNTLEMASAFGTLATNGVHVPPVAITKITDTSGRILYEAEPQEHQVLNPAISWIVTQILRKVILQGTGRAADIGRPAAGKTGTAQVWRDAWFVGFIPQLTAGVWVGFPQAQIPMVPPRTRIRITGGSFPASIWHAFMARATAGMPVRQFEKPVSQFVTVAVDVQRGCVATAATPAWRVRNVEYVRGTQPTQPCTGPGGVVVTGEPGALPSVVGLPLDTAQSMLRGLGLVTVVESIYNPAYPPGTVISQAPAPGSEVSPGDRVTLVVASNELAEVPSVIGMTQAQATLTLEGEGFTVTVRWAEANDPAYAGGVVLAQSPKPGAQKPPGTAVTLTLNPEPSPEPSPSPSPT